MMKIRRSDTTKNSTGSSIINLAFSLLLIAPLLGFRLGAATGLGTWRMGSQEAMQRVIFGGKYMTVRIAYERFFLFYEPYRTYSKILCTNSFLVQGWVLNTMTMTMPQCTMPMKVEGNFKT